MTVVLQRRGGELLYRWLEGGQLNICPLPIGPVTFFFAGSKVSMKVPVGLPSMTPPAMEVVRSKFAQRDLPRYHALRTDS